MSNRIHPYHNVPTTPILVVGGGPVGLALTGDLAWRGISSTLLERNDGSIYQPKMDLVGIRTMEFCRRWGIAQWVENSPYPNDYQQDYVYVTSLTGWELSREPFPAKANEAKPPQSPQKRERCPQDMFDPILRRFVASQGRSDVRYGHTLIDLEQFSDGVLATILHDDQKYQIWADFVVGCDGASSIVRELVDIGMTGNPALTYTVNIIFRCADFVSLHDKGEAYRFIFIGPEGTYATLVAINGEDRWRFSIVGDTHEKKYTEVEIQRVIERAVGRAFNYEILSIVPWTRRELLADHYRRNRVFIAGDAAHVMSPTGGFGMNTGIADAVDLSWKLDACVRGWGGPELLASYELERRPVGLRNVKEASKNLDRMLSTRKNPPPDEVFEEGPVGDAARAEYGQYFADVIRPEWFTIGIHLGYRYDPSPICWGEEGEPPPIEIATYEQSTWPGARAPHVWMKDGRSTLDLFGDGFTLMVLGSDPPPYSSLLQAAVERNVPVQVISLNEENVNRSYGHPLVLVRPDGHVAWRSQTQPRNPLEVIDLVSGNAQRMPQPTRTETV